MAPSYHRSEWNTRKCHYAMGATAVCDHQGRLIFVSTGYIGSMHDAYVYKKTDLYIDQMTSSEATSIFLAMLPIWSPGLSFHATRMFKGIKHASTLSMVVLE
ncbi:hypothetical protein MVEG_08657 [Podila verticillata NRRL 6337]|nr:hypothetical protein MVEG_08657 [Podila verticillata NRRL 6337]